MTAFKTNSKVNIKMPEEKYKWLKFYEGQCQFKVPFMMYADFESILKGSGTAHD